jgi:hypothetical protein
VYELTQKMERGRAQLAFRGIVTLRGCPGCAGRL